MCKCALEPEKREFVSEVVRIDNLESLLRVERDTVLAGENDWFQAGPDTLVTPSSTPQIKISIKASGTQPVLSWPIGALEQADDLTGAWAVLTNAASAYPLPTLSSKKFFRVRVN